MYEAVIDNRSVPNGTTKIKFSTPSLRKLFAEDAISILKANRPEAWIGGLVRVDIMWCKYLNKMIVIEFESLEASHDSNYFDTDIQTQLHQYLGVYHASSIISCLNTLLNKNIALLDYPHVNISNTYKEQLMY